MIALRHPIKAKIEDRYEFLAQLLHEYPCFLKKWEEAFVKNAETFAEETAGGDYDVKKGILDSYLQTVDATYYCKDMFYQSVLIMSYSYFESSVEIIKSDLGGFREADKIKEIHKRKNLKLTNEVSQALDFMNVIRELRNAICHNNGGTYKKTDLLKNLSETWDGFYFENSDNACYKTLIISKPDIVLETLNKARFILLDLCEKLNFKTTFIKG